ncbi:hypothetical protein [Methylomagnum sp.]
MGSEETRETLQEKLEFLRTEQASCSDPDMKFRLKKSIEDTQRRLAELDAQQVRREPSDLYEISRLIKYAPPVLFGRFGELAELDAALADPAIRVHSLIAFGGVGKTSLVAHWLQRVAESGWHGLARAFAWSFYSQGTRDEGAASSDGFFSAAFEFFGETDPALARLSPWDKGGRLGRAVRRRASLLVLDGLEPLQYPPGALNGRLKDQAMEALLLTLAEPSREAGLCLVTSREPVQELAGQAGARRRDLEFLSDEAGAALLFNVGVNRAGSATIGPDDAELREASREVKGHALTLTILGRYLAQVHRGDVRKRDTVALAQADARYKTNRADLGSPYGHAYKAMAAYEKWLAEGGVDGTRRLALLRVMGLFDRPADPGCLTALLRVPVIAGLTEPLFEKTKKGWFGLFAKYEPISKEVWSTLVTDLEAAGLLQTAAYSPVAALGYGEEIARKAMEYKARNVRFDLGEPQPFPANHSPLITHHSLEAHPLLRDYFARRLRDTQPEASREGHRRLFEHLQASVPYWPEGEAGLQPLYQAVAHGGRAGLYEEACTGVYWDRIKRHGENYSSAKLGLFGADLGAVAMFFEAGWSRPVSALSEADRAWLLNEAAFRLRALGRLGEALEPMRATLNVNAGEEQWKNAAVVASNLSELEITLGRVAAAVDDAESAVDYADRSGDAFWRMVNRTTLADVLHQAGRREEALERFREAEAMQAEWQPQYPWLYSLPGFRYCDVLLGEVERVAWLPCGWEWASAHDKDDGSGNRGLKPTPTEESLVACRAAAERAARTLEWAEQQGTLLLDIALDHLTLARAALYAALLSGEIAELATARSHARAAVDGLRAAGAQEFIIHGLLTHAWLQAVEGNPEAAQADLDTAERIATRGDMRLHLADIHLHRARLFRDRAALAEARRLIEECGYGRLRGELEDAERAARAWST